jgi:hypothetical protein
MGLKLTRRAPGIDGAILGGNTVTLRLPIGLTFHQVYFDYAFLATATPLSLADAVSEIRVNYNGKPSWNIRANELDSINQYQSRAAADGVTGILTVDFDRYNMRTRAAEEFTSIGTGMAGDPTPLTTFTIELDLKAAVTSGTLSARMRQSESRPLSFFKKIRRYVNAFGGAGTFEIDDFPKGDLINAVHFFESANDIDRLRLERDDFVMFDRTKELNARIQSDGVRTPQANLFVFDTAEDGNGTDQFVTKGVNDMRWFLEIDGAMTVTSLVEYLGTLEV